MKVVVIGAGMAGLSAAIRLQQRHHSVTVFERRGILGGRTTSFQDAATGDEVDNGTHLLVGACRDALNLFRRAGAEDLLRRQKNLRLDFIDRHGETSLICPPLPAPLHLVAGLLRMRLPWRARLSALRLGFDVRFRAARANETLAQYLTRVGQSSESRRLLWDPLATAILNETPDRADASLFTRVFTEAFLKSSRASALVFARRGWGTLAARLGRCVQENGGTLRLRTAVRSIVVENERVTGVRLSNGGPARDDVTDVFPADVVIAAVPWHALPALLPESIVVRPPFAALRRLAHSPIVSLDLWLDRRILPRPMIGLRDDVFEWIFDKGSLHDREGLPQHLSFVTSAAHSNLNRSNAELIALARRTLRRYWPAMAETQVVRSLVLREPHATFVCSPESQTLRPGPKTPIPGLYLAGDWTATRLPATIEGAVCSGYRAMAAILDDRLD